MNPQKNHPLLAVALCAAACLPLALGTPNAAAQVVIIQDSFGLNGTDREAGDPLAGTSPDGVGSTVWSQGVGEYGATFGASGGVGPETPTTTAENRIAVGQPTDVITVTLDIITGSSASWVGFGFLDSATTGTWWEAGNQVWSFIAPSGQWTLWKNGVVDYPDGLLLNGSVADFDSSKSYTFSLSYDPATQKARAYYLNGATEVNLYGADGGWFATGLADSAEIAAAGFRINGNPDVGGASLGSFTVTVPEPHVAALVIVGMGLTVAAGRRCRRAASTRTLDA